MPENSITIEDLRKIDFSNILAKSSEKDCARYSSVFLEEANNSERNGDIKSSEVFRMFFVITSSWFKPDSRTEVFNHAVASLNDEYLILLDALVPEITDSELQSRIADVLWERKKHFKYAEIAFAAYLASAIELEKSEFWMLPEVRLHRAFVLGKILGKDKEHYSSAVKNVHDFIERHYQNEKSYLALKLMELLFKNREGIPSLYSKYSESIAKRLKKNHDYRLAREYWEMKIKWDRKINNDEEINIAITEIAESYVNEANAMTIGERRSYMVASSHIEKAIQAYRRAKNKKERITELLKLLSEYQEESLNEFGQISTPVDLSDLVSFAESSVKGRNIYDAVMEYALLSKPVDPDVLKERLKDQIKDAPFAFMFGAVIVNEKGNVVGKKPSLFSQSAEELDEAMKQHVLTSYSQSVYINVHGLIEPARTTILRQHPIRIDLFYEILRNNPMVPEGREYIYAKGLLAGFEGDYVTALHLLLPQFENSVRYLLSQNGIVTTTLSPDGIQEELNLNTILYDANCEKIFGKNLLFEFQSLLIEKTGSNIRNRFAHGLLDPGHYFMPESIMTWYRIFQLCCYPSIREYRKKIDIQ